MPSHQFKSAFAKLNRVRREALFEILETWKSTAPILGSTDWSQIAANIESETALPIPIFTSLLGRWADSVAGGATAEDSWGTACREERKAAMLGRALAEKESPAVLGRATSLSSYAFHTSSSSFTEDTIKEILLDCPDGDPSGEYPALCDHLKANYLGGEIIWATFNEGDPAEDPFEGFPDDTTGVCTTLGLELSAEILILLSYERAPYATEPPDQQPVLYRPTIAEACRHYLFRPWHEPDNPWGYTSPTPPNEGGHGGRPEVVHRKIRGKGLRFPYRLSVTPS